MDVQANELSDEQKKQIAVISAYFVNVIGISTILYSSPQYWKPSYYTSALSRAASVQELIYGHKNRIKSELGMWLHVFMSLLATLQLCGLEDSCYVMIEEKAAISLYM